MAEAPATRRPRIAPKVRRMPNSRLDAEACRVRALRMVRYLKREHGICLTKKNGRHVAVKPRRGHTLTAAQAAGLEKGRAIIRARADRLRGTGKGKKRKATAPATTVNIDAAATALMGLGS